VSVLELTKVLIQSPSVTPKEAGSHAILIQRLAKLGFEIENLPFADVDNIWAKKGHASPVVVFAGHTDVVAPGPEEAWQSPPFKPTESSGYLYGRGAADMKGGLAAMVVGVEQFLAKYPHHSGSIAFLITSDEEGVSINGTKKVIEVLQKRNEKIDYCIIGEPSSEEALGDQIRIGRRGSLHGKLIVYGKQSHIAYPVPGQNPIHECLAALQELTQTQWDNGNDHFPPTSFQISNIKGGTGSLNVTPGQIEVNFNFRFSNVLTAEQLQEAVLNILKEYNFKFDVEWSLSGEPFLTKQGRLIAAAKQAIQEVTGRQTRLSTGGGTSDGRFIAVTGAEIIELGLKHETAHQVNECISVEDLTKLPDIYHKILNLLLTD
jgi:succinyl-diaminopimelate desuccinylase